MIGEIDPKECWTPPAAMYIPGFIDGHTHLDLPVAGTVTADDFASGTTAAVCGGTTTVVDFATQYKGDTILNALETWKKKAEGRPRATMPSTWRSATGMSRRKADLPALREAGVTSFKVYMAYDTALTDAQILEVLRKSRKFGGVTGCHCENGGLVTALQKQYLAAGHTDTSAHPLSRPAEVEAEAVNRFCYLGRLADAPINIVHLSTRLGLEEIREGRAEGLGRTATRTASTSMWSPARSICCLMTAITRLPDFEGAKYVCSPPLRKQEDMEALRGGDERRDRHDRDGSLQLPLRHAEAGGERGLHEDPERRAGY